ncbi:MAG: hypothetical protein RIQ51_1792 [Bacteroidota bacterium]
MTTEEILKALSNVQEPDLGKDLVTLNMIQDVKIDGDAVSFTIVLTTPACPMKDLMKNASENAIKLLVNPKAQVQVNFTSNTTSLRKDEKSVLSKVKNIIAVVSGKGGVGKTSLACNVGLALSQLGNKVLLLDADVSLANVDLILGLTPRGTIRHVLEGHASLRDILLSTAEGLDVIPASSGVEVLQSSCVALQSRISEWSQVVADC